MSGSNYFVFLWKPKCPSGFLNQYGRQFILHYAREAIDTVGVACIGMGQDTSLGAAAPRASYYVPGFRTVVNSMRHRYGILCDSGAVDKMSLLDLAGCTVAEQQNIIGLHRHGF